MGKLDVLYFTPRRTLELKGKNLKGRAYGGVTLTSFPTLT